MKNSRSAILKRQNKILQKLNSNGSILIEDIAKELNVSPLTVRRDLNELSEQGLAERFFGGARQTNRVLREDPASRHKNEAESAKQQAIAACAAELVEEGETLLINSSTTAFNLFSILADKNLTIITNNANALQTVDNAKFQLIFTGGEINTYKHSMVGTFAVQILKRMRADKCFIGVSGISENGVLSTAVLQETAVNMAMMDQTNDAVVILTDSSKIGVQHNFDIGTLDKVTHIITDSDITEEQLAMLKKYDLEIIIAES